MNPGSGLPADGQPMAMFRSYVGDAIPGHGIVGCRTEMNARIPDADVRKALGVGRTKGPRVVKWIVLAVVGVVVVGGVLGLVRKRAAAQAPHYLTEPVRRADVHVTVSATGKLQGLNTVEVGAEVTGKVLRVLVDYNDRVKQGQVLAEIDPEQLNAALEETNAQVLSADANIRTSQATLLEAKQARDRAEEQAKQGLISQKDLETARATAARAEASLASATASASVSRASLKSAQSRVGKTKIVSPIDGIVLARAVEPGQTVTAGFQTPVLFRVAEDLTKLSLHVDVDEADIGRVKEGAEASFNVDAYPQRNFPSKVLSLRNEPKSSQSVVSYEAILTVDNSEHLLRPGMTATATITSETVKDTPVVPNAALRFTPPVRPGVAPPPPPKAEEKRVYVLRDNAPALVPVKTGATDGHVTQLVSPEPALGTEVVIDVVAPR
jgi:HlyD family secretion protein